MRFFTSGVKVNMGQTNLPAQLLVQSQQQFGAFPHFMVQSLQASLLSIKFSMMLVIICETCTVFRDLLSSFFALPQHDIFSVFGGSKILQLVFNSSM